MQAELQALWKEQCDQLRKKKEQFATEVSKIQLTPLKWEKTTVMVTNLEAFFFNHGLFARMVPSNIRTNVVMCCPDLLPELSCDKNRKLL